MNKRLNLIVALCMLQTFGDDIKIDHNEQQGLVTLTNPDDDCYCTLAEKQYEDLMITLHQALDEDMRPWLTQKK